MSIRSACVTPIHRTVNVTDLHTLDRGGIAIGGGADGEGEHPPPLSLPIRELYNPHPRFALLPRPPGGGSAWRYSPEIRVRVRLIVEYEHLKEV